MPKPVITPHPILIIDDEADHASIDTKRHNWLKVTNVNDVLDDEYSTIEKPDPEHDPSRTNECIRRILIFSIKKSLCWLHCNSICKYFYQP